MASRLLSRRRTIWLLAALSIVLIAAVAARSSFYLIPHRYAYHCLRDGDLSGAEWWLSAAKRIAPEHAETLFVEARFWRHKQELERARQCLDRAQDLGLAADRILREEWMLDAQDGKLKQADQRLAELLGDPRGEEAEICEAFVLGFTKVRSFSIAHAVLAAWERDDPRNPQPHFLRAKILQEDRLWSEAQKCAAEALQLKPKHGGANLLVGQLLLADKQPEAAIPYFERAQADTTTYAAARLGQARAWIALGKLEMAQPLLEELLANDPAGLDAAVALAQLEMSRGEYPTALARLDPLLKSKPFDLDLRYAHATALRGVGRVEEANGEFESFAQARAEIDRAVKLKETMPQRPEDPTIPMEIGKICLRNGLEKEGLLWLQIVLDHDPENAETHQMLAEYYFAHRKQDPRFGALARQHALQAESGRTSHNRVDK